MDVAPTAPLAPPALPAERPQGWGEFFHMPVFHPGTRVRFGERLETVSHITIRRHDLCVHLVGHDSPVAPEKLVLQPSVFATCRMP
ncbi:hypothetical protein C8244_09885 [Paracidovorax avenae]|uniref:hypothetical protein n=2 Tax=Comamonadaceae TaxID=80864 RepID=UPI000D16EAEA|nr:hypothetical protein [Paracidovorax avenae]AVS70696.1 hypothetical protein C8247_09845 [Paracidovorax avenae]AVS81263.1 hypothetical protein C8237_09330 [Paracidovorax avenae]AVS99041.1 hypothetical protein C8236_09530 [Paracidovorax avenae]AVT16476.1 hypothetical protein C8244_09885 [Paracidovorax avenae]AVT20462.1 hypothetical protein C7Y68_11020 [Paracidovorax avenae]